MIQFGKMVTDGVFANSTAIYENNSIKITSPSNSEVINFYAPVDGNSNDSYFVNNSLVTLLNQVGETPDYGWKEGSPIYGVYDSNNNKLFIKTTKSKIKYNYSAVLSENTWAQIAEAVANNDPIVDSWQIGDTKDEVIAGETLTFAIMGKNMDDLADGSGKAGLTFGMTQLMASTRQMNSSNTNSGSFAVSAMYSWLNTTIYPNLPTELKDAIKAVNKKTASGGGSSSASSIRTDPMYLWLFAEIEVFGTTTYSYEGEGTQYPYFVTASERIKKLSNGSGAASYWWERSPHRNDSRSFCSVNISGIASCTGASSSFAGISFGFCV